MKRWIAVAVAVGVLAGSLAGCVNVDPPDGPYVQWGSASASGRTEADVKGFEKFLKKAREDGLITKSQYKELMKRLEREFKD